MLLTLSKSVEEEVGRFVYDRKIYRSELPRYDYYQTNNKENIQAFNSKLGIGEDDQALLFRVYSSAYVVWNVLAKGVKVSPNSLS